MLSSKFAISGALLLAALVLLPTTPASGLPTLFKLPEPRTYMAGGGARYGYKEKQQADGSWRIFARTLNRDGMQFSQDMAVYRAAEVAKDAGKSWFKIVDLSTRFPIGGSDVDQINTWLIMLPVDDADTPVTCRSENAAVCRAFNVEETIARIGPTLRRPMDKSAPSSGYD